MKYIFTLFTPFGSILLRERRNSNNYHLFGALQNFSSFDECSLAMDPDCYYTSGKSDSFQYTFFCGNALECFEYNNRDALEVSNEIIHFMIHAFLLIREKFF